MPDVDDIPTAALPPMSSAERAGYRTAGYRAVGLYPGAIGELLARELLAADEFGWALGADSLIARVRDQVMREYAARGR